MADNAEIKQHFWKKLADSPFVMNRARPKWRGHSEPLTAQLDEGSRSTLCSSSSARTIALAGGGAAMAQFVSKGHDFFACLAGTARIDNDFAMIDKFVEQAGRGVVSGWQGRPSTSRCCASTWTMPSSGRPTCRWSGKVKMLFGAKIDPSEEGSHAKVNTTAVLTPYPQPLPP